jgi:DivIVA domain-containing protein
MSATAVGATRFRPTLFRPGYDAGEVDTFMQVVEDAMRSPAPRVSADDVARQRFTPVLLKPGYRMDDVDAYLAEAERQLGERHPRSA